MAADVKALIARGERLKSDRSTWEGHWNDVRNYENPSGRGFIEEDTPGSRRRVEVLDNTAEPDGLLLASSLFGMMMVGGVPDFKVKAQRDRLNRLHNVRIWNDDTTRRVRKVFAAPQSGFAMGARQVFEGEVFYGTQTMYSMARPGRLPLFQARPLAETCVAQGADGRVDTVFRLFEMSARQAWQDYSDKCGERCATDAQNAARQDQLYQFLHAVFPRTDAIEGRLDARNKPVASVHINVTELHGIREGGFDEMPYHTWRWRLTDKGPYGRSPGIAALSDVKLLQRAMRATIRGAEITIEPPLQVADDGVIGSVSLRSRALNKVRWDIMMRGNDAIKPLTTGAQPAYGEEFCQARREQIHDHFLKNLLAITRDPRMTATQFLEVLEEVYRILHPYVAAGQSEWFAPMIERTLLILLRAGALLPLPEELEGEDFEIEFTSPIARAQALVEVQGVARTIELMAPMWQADPTILLDNQQGDETYRYVAEKLGQPQRLLRAPAEVVELRRQRAEAEQAAATQDSVVQLAQAAGQAAPMLRELREAG